MADDVPDELRVPGFDPAILLEAETEVIARTVQGEAALFDPTERVAIRAVFLRRLLLQIAPQAWPIRLLTGPWL